MLDGMLSKDVKITVVNDTNDDCYFVFFTQDTNIKGMWTNIFPAAWQVIPIAGKGYLYKLRASQNTFTYPAAMEAAVIEHNSPYAPNTATTKQPAQFSEQFEYYINPNGFKHLKKLDTKNADNTISIKNSGDKKVDMAILKNGTPILVYRGQHQDGVAKGDTAGLMITPRICAWYRYNNEINTYDLITSQAAASESYEIDLTRYSDDISVMLTCKDDATQEKKWVVTDNK